LAASADVTSAGGHVQFSRTGFGAVAAPCLDDGSCLPDGLAATVIAPACDATLPNAITRQPVSVIDVPDL
jgi:hypothetical protein